MDPKVLQSIASIKNAINGKMLDIKRGHSDDAVVSKRLLSSVNEPLAKLVSLKENQQKGEMIISDEDYLSDTESYATGENVQWDEPEPVYQGETDTTSTKFQQKGTFQQLIEDSTRDSGFDKVYGPKMSDGILKLGKFPLEVVDNRYLRVLDKNFPISDGLLDLLLYKDPYGYSKNDLKNYREMLEMTDRHLNQSGILKRQNCSKYTNLISKLFGKKHEEAGSPKKTTGGQYVYFDDYNEIVDRLRLLVASQQAGNTSHGNEIISILEQLRQQNLIY